MTGIVGFIGSDQLIEQKEKCISEMSGVTANTWQQFNCQLVLKVPKLGVAHDSFENDVLCIDIFGDIFSSSANGDEEKVWGKEIAQAYLANQLEEYLFKLNGYFTLVILDKSKKVLKLASDRLGHRPLYLWYDAERILGFSSEIKGLLLHPNHNVKLDKKSAKMFVDVGQMLGKETLFSNIKRIAPATLITLDIDCQQYNELQYWRWSEIAKNDAISFEQATDDLYHFFEQAMKRCLNSITENNLSITLSGGLDSRVLLASAKNNFKGEINTFTFGQIDCDDAVIASQVSKLANVSNQLVEIQNENWFDGREDGVWLTDGLKNILHMHALSSVKDISKQSSYLLNGYIGDLVLGGSYLFDEKDKLSSPGKKTSDSYIKYADKTGLNSDYFEFEGTDPFLIYNRCVRFVSAGSDLLSYKLNNLKPFIDNDLLEFAYSLPDLYRKDSKLYNNMLLKYYPDYFLTVPWQKTGQPISNEPVTNLGSGNLNPFMQMIAQLIKGSPLEALARKAYRKLSGKRSYAVYEDWLRTPEFRDYIESILLSDNSYVSQLFTPKFVESLVSDFYKGKLSVKLDSIGCFLTLEIYLSQVSRFKKIEID